MLRNFLLALSRKPATRSHTCGSAAVPILRWLDSSISVRRVNNAGNDHVDVHSHVTISYCSQTCSRVRQLEYTSEAVSRTNTGQERDCTPRRHYGAYGNDCSGCFCGEYEALSSSECLDTRQARIW